MRTAAIRAALALVAALAATAALAQAPQTVRLRGVIEKVDGNTVTAKSDKGDALTLNLADKMLVVAVVKASLADIKNGDFIGSGAMPQPDGSQKAIEVHIFAESMRGTKDGDKKIIVTPDVPIVRYEVADLSALKPGVAFSVLAAVKTPDGSYDIKRINVGRDGVVPR
jgi:hypothetical protein